MMNSLPASRYDRELSSMTVTNVLDIFHHEHNVDGKWLVSGTQFWISSRNFRSPVIPPEAMIPSPPASETAAASW